MTYEKNKEISTKDNFYLPNWDVRGINGAGYAKLVNFDEASAFVDSQQLELQQFGFTRISMGSIVPGGGYEFGSGNATAPGIRWAADTNTGFYWNADGDMRVSINGTYEVAFNSSGIAINDMTQGSVLFAGPNGQITQDNAHLFWDNTNTFLKISSPGGETFRMTYRTATDGITPGANTNAALLRLTDASSGATNGNTLSLGFYTLGSLIRFDGDYSGHGLQSSLEFWGVDNIASAGAASPICTMVTSSTVHEVHCPRGNTDIDAIIHAIPVGSTPVIYTESGGNNSLDFGVSRQRLFRLTTSGATGTGDVLYSMTASATNKSLTYEFRDNGFAGTLKARLIYAGSNGAGSRYFGLINDAGDYLALASDSTIFYNAAFGTEYARFDSSGNLGIGVSPSTRFHVKGASLDARFTGSAANQTLTLSFYDNNTTLEAKFVYAGANSAGSRYFALVNGSADYVAIASDSQIFYNTSFGTEYGRWTSTDWRPGTTNSFDLGASSKVWKTVYFGTQAIGPAGSAGTPAYTFTGTTDGFYSRTSGALDITIGGARTFEFDAANMYIVVNSGAYNIGAANDVVMSRTAAGSLGIGGQSNGQKIAISTLTELTTIAAAATTDTAIQIPLDAVVFAVSVRVTVAIPTATTFTVTGTTSGTQFDVAGGVSTAANTTDVGTRNTPYKNGAAQTIRITPNVNPAANSGRVRTTIHYYQITPATS